MKPMRMGFILTMGGLATVAATTIFPALGYAASNATIVALDAAGKGNGRTSAVAKA
jgi:hypothetical protein